MEIDPTKGKRKEAKGSGLDGSRTMITAGREEI